LFFGGRGELTTARNGTGIALIFGVEHTIEAKGEATLVTNPETEMLSHHGYDLRISHIGSDWLVYVSKPDEGPKLVTASTREAAIAKAHSWIEERFFLQQRQNRVH